MTPSRKFIVLVACCVAASAVLVGHGSAGLIFHESFRVDGSFEFESLCDVAGLAVRETWVTDVRVSAVQHGPEGLAYFLEQGKEIGAFTNLATGKTVTRVTTANLKDLKVTDNGDGTLTILSLGTGNEVMYGADGKAIARNPGQSRFEFLIDHGGTPADPSDDEFIADLGRVKGSTGRNDDFCATVVPALTGE